MLVSTDPAHNPADLFGRSPGPSPTRMQAGLDVVELDPDHETHRYLERVKATLRPLVSGERSETAFRQLDLARHAPDTEEAALFDALVGQLLDTGEAYDRLIFDTAPDGHTVRLLARGATPLERSSRGDLPRPRAHTYRSPVPCPGLL